MYERIRPRRGRELGVNLTPMIDIVFLLLIFFVLIAQFSSRQRAEVQLPAPKPSAAEYVYNPGKLTITVICDEQGKLAAYQADGEMIGLRQVELLAQKLRDHKKVNPQVEVDLRADRRADGRVIEALMGACAEVGIRQVNLVAAMNE